MMQLHRRRKRKPHYKGQCQFTTLEGQRCLMRAVTTSRGMRVCHLHNIDGDNMLNQAMRGLNIQIQKVPDYLLKPHRSR